MDPLAAFQVLVLAMAAAMAVEAVKPSYSREWRILFWVFFLILGVAGIATQQIAAAWPAASSFMVWVGSNPVALFLAFITWVIVLQKPWRRVTASAAADPLPKLDHPPFLEHDPGPPEAYDDSALRAEIQALSERLDKLEAAGPAPDVEEAVKAVQAIAALPVLKEQLEGFERSLQTYKAKWAQYESFVRSPSPDEPSRRRSHAYSLGSEVEQLQFHLRQPFPPTLGAKWPEINLAPHEIPAPLQNGISDEDTFNQFRKRYAENHLTVLGAEKVKQELQDLVREYRSRIETLGYSVLKELTDEG